MTDSYEEYFLLPFPALDDNLRLSRSKTFIEPPSGSVLESSLCSMCKLSTMARPVAMKLADLRPADVVDKRKDVNVLVNIMVFGGCNSDG
jgi:hypothetical protein